MRDSIGEKSRFHSVFGEELVLNLYGGFPHAKLLGTITTLEAHQEPIVTVSTDNIDAANIGVLKPHTHGCLTSVAEELAQLSEPVYSTWSKTELLGARLADYVDVEVLKTVISIKTAPSESYFGRCVSKTNLGAILHDSQEYIESRVCQLAKNRHSTQYKKTPTFR